MDMGVGPPPKFEDVGQLFHHRPRAAVVETKIIGGQFPPEQINRHPAVDMIILAQLVVLARLRVADAEMDMRVVPRKGGEFLLEQMLVAIAQAVEKPNRPPAFLVNERGQHAEDWRDADSAADQHHRLRIGGLEGKITQGGAQVEDVSLPDLVVKNAGAEPGGRGAGGGRAGALDRDAIMRLLWMIAEAVAADELAALMRAGQTEGDILAGLESRQRLGVVGRQVEGTDLGVLHHLAVDDEFAKSIPRQRLLGQLAASLPQDGKFLFETGEIKRLLPGVRLHPPEGGQQAQAQQADDQQQNGGTKISPKHGRKRAGISAGSSGGTRGGRVKSP